MIISTGLFFVIAAGAVTLFMFLTMALQKENNDFIDTLQFHLRQRTMDHNKVKAQMAVLKTRFAQLEKENFELKQNQAQAEIGFEGLLGEAEFVEARNQKIQDLENKINELKSLEISNFR